MSATGRGGVRVAEDFYPTPRWCVDRILEAVDLPGGAWLEPSAGDGAIVRAVNAGRADVTWSAVELRPECYSPLLEAVGQYGAVVIADFIRSPPPLVLYNVAILNPPFTYAMEFITACLALAGWVVVLERLNWLEGEDRNEWLRAHVPDVYVLPNRPSFTGDGTDSNAYAWFIWPPDGHNRTAGKLNVLRSTPLNERRTPLLALPDLTVQFSMF